MKTVLAGLLFSCIGMSCARAHLFSFEGLTRKDTALVYRGWENPIRIVDYQAGVSYQVLAKHGEISPVNETGSFVYRVREWGVSDTLTLYAGGRFMGQMPLSVCRIPDPELRLAGAPPGNLSKSSMFAAPYMVARFPGCYLNCFLQVTDFTLRWVYGGMEMHYQISGNRITDDALKQMAAYKGRLRLYFDNVRFRGCGICSRTTQFSYELF